MSVRPPRPSPLPGLPHPCKRSSPWSLSTSSVWALTCLCPSWGLPAPHCPVSVSLTPPDGPLGLSLPHYKIGDGSISSLAGRVGGAPEAHPSLTDATTTSAPRPRNISGLSRGHLHPTLDVTSSKKASMSPQTRGLDNHHWRGGRPLGRTQEFRCPLSKLASRVHTLPRFPGCLRPSDIR